MTPFPKLFCAILTLLAVFGPNAMAQTSETPGETAPQFGLPLACTPGKDCWILNYPDVGPSGDGAPTDTACLSRTYEAHKGTDFAIADEAAMKKGVDVVAARDGTVTRVRDGEPDRWATKEDLEKTRAAKRECGNAVLIDHGAGWQTMYCHMKLGSLIVKAGQKIKAGAKIGQVGMSGETEFPHLHLGLIHKNKVIDPFTGADLESPCGQKGRSLWNPAAGISYAPLVFFDTGFGASPPRLQNLDRVRKDHASLPRDSDALVFHAVILGAREDDAVTLSITTPDGEIFAQDKKVQGKTRARQMYYVGRNIRKDAPLETGAYIGKIIVTRGAENPQTFTDRLSVSIE